MQAMSKASSLKGNPDVAAPGRDVGKLPRPHSAARIRHKDDRSRALIVVAGLVLVLGVATVMASRPLLQFVLGAQPENSRANPAEERRIGRMVIDTGSSVGCRQGTFDNQTGRMTAATEQCDTDVLDKNGIPVPQGTINRLNSISKSFSNR
jgi:hypothetical protein